MDEIGAEMELLESELTAGSMNELQESEKYESLSNCSDKTIDFDYQVDQTLSLFPFVCGLCNEKFNNVEEYYSHFGTSHTVAQRYFHSSRCSTDAVAQERRLFYCGKCSFVSLSLCQLHEHLVEVENARAYQFVTDSRTAYPSAVKQESLSVVDLRETETLEYDHDDGSSTNNVTHREQYHNKDTKTRNVKSNKRVRKSKSDTCMVKDKTILKTTVDLERHTVESLKTISENLSKRPQKSRKVKNNITDKKKSRCKSIKREVKSEQKEITDEVTNEKNEFSDYEEEHDEMGYPSDTPERKQSNQLKDTDESQVCKTEDSIAETASTKKAPCSKESQKVNKEVKKKSIQPCEMYIPCDRCGRSIKRRRLHIHMMNDHNDERNFPCDECGFRFKCQLYLQMHKRTVHVADDSSICQVCGKTFKNPGYLRQHVEIHSERNKKCPQCPATFRTRLMLKRHLLRHSDEKPHKCSVCGKVYSFRDEKPHKCSVCGKAYSFRGNMTNHMRVVHTDKRPHPCPTCGKNFKTRKDMRKHMLIHEPPKYECPVCSHMFVTPCNRKIHMKMHIRRGEYTEEELVELRKTQEKLFLDT